MAAIARSEQRRALVIAAIGFGLVVVLFVVSRVLTGGNGDGGSEAVPPRTPPPTSPSGPGDGRPPGVADGAGTRIPPLPDGFEVAELRDPFTPPFQSILSSRFGLGPGDTGDGGTGDGGTGDGGTGSPGADPAARVTLRSVGEDADGEATAAVSVDGTVSQVSEGDRFGPGGEFQVVSLDLESRCGMFLFGDEPFTECVGESVPQK